MGRAARRGKTGFTGQILQTWRRIRLSAAAAHGASKHKRRRRTARRDGERRPLEKSYVNDTRRRPATVAVAVCIGSYARIIFVDG